MQLLCSAAFVAVINATLLFPTGDVIHQISQDIDLYTAGMYTCTFIIQVPNTTVRKLPPYPYST